MNTVRLVGSVLVLLLLISFKPASACEYAESNISFVRTQTENALTKEDFNLVRYHSFKALNAIEKSKKELNACRCEYALISIEESAYLLKRATRAVDIKDAKNLLKRALQNTVSGIEALHKHDEEHIRSKADDLLAINERPVDTEADGATVSPKIPLKEKLDASLDDFRESLDAVVRTVNCKDAEAFAERIYENCEQELLKEGLSESKKYYNLTTQKITSEALERIREKCTTK